MLLAADVMLLHAEVMLLHVGVMLLHVGVMLLHVGDFVGEHEKKEGRHMVCRPCIESYLE